MTEVFLNEDVIDEIVCEMLDVSHAIFEQALECCEVSPDTRRETMIRAQLRALAYCHMTIIKSCNGAEKTLCTARLLEALADEITELNPINPHPFSDDEINKALLAAMRM